MRTGTRQVARVHASRISRVRALARTLGQGPQLRCSPGELQIQRVAGPRNQPYLDHEVAGIWRPLAVSGRGLYFCQGALRSQPQLESQVEPRLRIGARRLARRFTAVLDRARLPSSATHATICFGGTATRSWCLAHPRRRGHDSSIDALRPQCFGIICAMVCRTHSRAACVSTRARSSREKQTSPPSLATATVSLPSRFRDGSKRKVGDPSLQNRPRQAGTSSPTRRPRHGVASKS